MVIDWTLETASLLSVVPEEVSQSELGRLWKLQAESPLQDHVLMQGPIPTQQIFMELSDTL